jgi:ATP-dependent protease ClpP protease subunit
MNSPTHKEVYLSFSANVTPASTQGLLSAIANVCQKGATDIHLLLSTNGGVVSCGINIYNVLEGLPITVHTYNVGNVDSIGNVIYLAGKHRYACPNARFMFHGVSQFIQNKQVDEKSLKEAISMVRNDQERIGRIVVERTNINADELAELFVTDSFLTVEAATEKGIVHAIGNITIPKNAPFFQLVFND